MLLWKLLLLVRCFFVCFMRNGYIYPCSRSYTILRYVIVCVFVVACLASLSLGPGHSATESANA